MNPKHGLGRGLGALLGPSVSPTPDTPAGTQEIATDSIIANANQPRKSFDNAALHELSESLKRTGVLQPIVVRRFGQQFQMRGAGEPPRWQVSLAFPRSSEKPPMPRPSSWLS